MPQVLIADDNPLARRRLESAVRKWKYDVVLASDGNEAWSCLRGPEAPRLAILDWHMPGLSGIEICQRVRDQGGDRYPFLILLTNRTDRDSLIEGLTSGADDYVRQPFDADELEQRLRTGRRIVELQDRLLTTQAILQVQATHDALTGVLNRGEILRRLDRELTSGAGPLAVMLVDIDHFKLVNDRYGHLAGDVVLKRVADGIAANVRETDAVGRYGGEEFLVLLPGASGADVAHVAERVRSGVAQGSSTQAGQLPASVSIGWAQCVVRNPSGGAELIHRADEALYRAKGDGRDCVRAAKEEEA